MRPSLRTIWRYRILLTRCAFRHWREQPAFTALLILLLASGVGVFLAIQLANRSAVATFDLFAATVAGQTDWVITSPTGLLREEVLFDLRERLLDQPVWMAPVLETTASPLPDQDASAKWGQAMFRVVGLDLIGLLNFPTTDSGQGPPQAVDDEGVEIPLGRLLNEPRTVLVTSARAARMGWQVGETIAVIIGDQPVELRIGGFFPTRSGSSPANDRVLIMDLPEVQDLMQKPGFIERIEFRLVPGPREEERRDLLFSLLEDPDGRWEVMAPEVQGQAGALMSRAFRLNLTVLSLLALLVGWFLMQQALDSAVVRRREEIAILRSLGVPPAIIRGVWLVESAVLGLIGSALGILLGWVGAQGAVRAVSTTINALYQSTAVDRAILSLPEVLIALVAGLAVSVAAGLKPARAASRIPPAQILGRANLSTPPWFKHPAWPLGWAVAALFLLTLSPIALPGGGFFALGPYLAAFSLIMSAVLVVPHLLRALGALTPWVGRYSPCALIGWSIYRQPSSRHHLAAGGLILAFSMAGGMVILIQSFEQTVERWIGTALRADLFLISAGHQAADSRNRISAAVAQTLAEDPEVEVFDPYFQQTVRWDGQTITVAGVDLDFRIARGLLSWIQSPPGQIDWRDASGGSVPTLASESFLRRLGEEVGETIQLPTPDGLRTLRIAGSYADFGNERGTLLLDTGWIREWYDLDTPLNASVYLQPGSSPAAVRARWEQTHPGLRINLNAELREEVLRLFRQTFAITYALQFIAIVVAVAGLTMALASSLLTRREEWTSLREMGMTRTQLASCAAWEAAVLTLAGLLIGAVLSILLGLILIYGVNRQTFGWTLDWFLPIGRLGLFALLVASSAILTAWLTGRALSNLRADHPEE